jgi:hypothetical protein
VKKDSRKQGLTKTQGIPNPKAYGNIRLDIPEGLMREVLLLNSLKQLLSVEESAWYLGRRPDAIRDLIYGAELPVCQRGKRGKIYIHRVDLDSWIQKNKRDLRDIRK